MSRHISYEVRVFRRCLVCDAEEEVWETEDADEIGSPCSRCRAPTERVRICERRRTRAGINPHAGALGHLGGVKGGPARAAKLSARRRRAIARTAAIARWANRDRPLNLEVAPHGSPGPKA